MARRLGRLASDSASVALLLLMTASAVFHSDQQEVVALVQESTGAQPSAPPEYEKIAGLRYIPKEHMEFAAANAGACQDICDKRGPGCNSFNYNAKLSKCKISKQHLGYDPDFIMEQKGLNEATNSRIWELIPGMTGFQSGYLRVTDQSHMQCRKLCVKAPACNSISYRKRDGLCLLTGRTLEINTHWIYYEKKGVPENSAGYVLPVKGITHKAGQVNLATLQAHMASQVSASKEELDQEQASIQKAEAKAQVEAIQMKAETGKVNRLEQKIEGIRASSQKKLEAANRKLNLEIKENKLEIARNQELMDEQYRRQKAADQIKFVQDEAKLSAKAKLEATELHNKGLLEHAKTKAEKDKYAAQIQHALQGIQALHKREASYGKSEEEIKENFGKKMAIHNEAVLQQAKQDRKHLQRDEKRFLKKLHVRNEEGTIEVAKAGNAQKREIAFEHQSNMESAKHTMMLYQREYEDALTKSRSNDKFHEKRVKFYTQKLKAQKKKVHALRAQALSIESRGNATRAKILMEMNATVTDLSDKMATAADEIQTAGEVREAKKERKEKQQMEMDRMHERQREREEVANKAAMKSVSDKQANAESAAAKMAAAAAYEKLQKVAQEAGSLPDAEGEAMVSAAKKEYEDFVASQNEKLKAIHVQLPSKTVVHDPVDHASITFDVAQNAPTPS